jgi:AhpD family alkylhydroperoxidase
MQTLRLPYYDIAPELTEALRSIVTRLEKSALGIQLIELVYLRISQINGCEFCLRLHSRKLSAVGESEVRLQALGDWRVSPLFTAREKAAFNWAESLTRVEATHAPDADYEPLTQHFSNTEITELTFAIVSMNALNRLAIGMRRTQ